MKKALSLFLAFIMTFGVVVVGISETPHSHAEEAVSQIFTENNFVYKISNGNAIIVDYTDKESTDEIFIPETLGGYPVTKLNPKSFKGCQCIAVTIPATVTSINVTAFAYDMPNLERYTVDADNTKYSSENGILYSANTIVAYPKNAPEESISLSAISVDPFAFTEVSNLKSITLSYGYVNEKYTSYSIKEYAFYNATSLESVEMNKSINSIGDYAFASCSSLVSVKIYDLVESLGWEIFADTPFINNPDNYDFTGVLYLHKNLIATHPSGDKEYFAIPASTESIAGGAFQWNSLKEVSINSGIENIISNPFAKCPNLETFTVQSGEILAVDNHGVLYNKNDKRIIAYPNGRHESCYNAGSINSLSGILPYAFYLSPIKNLYIPSLSNIGYCALGGEGVTDIYYDGDESDWENACYDKAIYDTMVTAEDVANIHFDSYSVAEHYLITDNAVQSVCSCGYTVEHTYADGNCTEDGFVYDIIGKKAVIKGYKFRESTSALVIPETIDGYPVTKLECGAFRDCMFTSVQIPASVTEIAPEAFAYALNNQSFTVASGNANYKAIDGVLFKNGSVIALVAYPQNAPASEYQKPAEAVEILPYAFCGSKNLKTLDSWQSVTVRDYAFVNSSIETVSGSDFQWIGNGAFKNSSLKDFSITSTPEFFGYNAFAGTPFLENAVYDEDGAFYHENILVATDTEHDKNYYEVKEATTVIAGGAIKWKSLEEIYIPASVETVNGSSFSEATSLKTFRLDSNNENFRILYDGVLFNSAATKLIAYPPAAENVCFSIPRVVTEIGAFAFNNVKWLCCVHVPKTVKTVGEFAFGMCGFEHISRIKSEREEINWREIDFVQSGSDMVSCEMLIPKTYETYPEGNHANVKTETKTQGTGCDKETYVVYTCACGCAYDFSLIPPKAHVPNEEYTVVRNASCTGTGEKELRCSVCSKTLKTKTIPALGHDYELVEHIKPTCVNSGEKTYKCKRCNIEKTEEAEAALGHISSGETVKIDPTCTEDGGLYYLCIRCNEPIYDEWIEIYPATGHTEGEWKRTQEPTCSNHQVDTLFCSVCTMAIENKIGDLGDHNYRSRVTVKNCTRIRTRYECVYCDYYYYDDIKVSSDAIMGDNEYGLGHIVEDVVYEPTCTEYGEIFKECIVCGAIVGNVTQTADPLGHSWEEEIYREPTCTEEGEMDKWCTVCGEYEYEYIPVIAHTFEKWDYESGNTFSGVCSVCEEVFEVVDVEITLDRSELTLYNQGTKTLSVTVTENISDNIVFTSSDSNIAVVDSNGTITANAPGKAVITARIAGTEIMAQCEITVKARTFALEWIVDGETYDSGFVEEGAKIEAPEAPEKSGCVFAGWSPEVPETMPSNSLSFTAAFVIVSQSDDFDVSATYLPGCFNEEINLDVAEIQGEREPGGVYLVEGEYYKQIGLYNIKTVNENSEVIQPNEGYTVTIKMAIPEAYKNNTSFIIYHRFTDGGREQLSTENGTLRVENGYLVFEVSQFSEFELFVPSAYIKITRLPDKTVYKYNTAQLDLTGIRLKLTRPDGTTKMLTESSPLTVTGFDGTKAGKQIVTVSYGQYSDTFEVTVKYNWWQWIIYVLFHGFFQW